MSVLFIMLLQGKSMGKFVGQIGRLDIVHGGPDGVANVLIELLKLSNQLLYLNDGIRAQTDIVCPAYDSL